MEVFDSNLIYLILTEKIKINLTQKSYEILLLSIVETLLSE